MLRACVLGDASAVRELLDQSAPVVPPALFAAVQGGHAEVVALLAAYLEFQPPFERHLVPETLPRVSYPHRGEQTFPTWTLPFLGVIIPVSVILAASLVQTDSALCSPG